MMMASLNRSGAANSELCQAGSFVWSAGDAGRPINCCTSMTPATTDDAMGKVDQFVHPGAELVKSDHGVGVGPVWRRPRLMRFYLHG
jgi:hypothetical protein